MKKNFIVFHWGRGVGKQAMFNAMEELKSHQLSASEMAEIAEKLGQVLREASKSMYDFGEVLNKEIKEPQRGVIPDRFKNNIHLRKPVRK